MQSNISKSEEYLAFRSTVALKSVIVDHDDSKVCGLVSLDKADMLYICALLYLYHPKNVKVKQSLCDQ